MDRVWASGPGVTLGDRWRASSGCSLGWNPALWILRRKGHGWLRREATCVRWACGPAALPSRWAERASSHFSLEALRLQGLCTRELFDQSGAVISMDCSVFSCSGHWETYSHGVTLWQFLRGLAVRGGKGHPGTGAELIQGSRKCLITFRHMTLCYMSFFLFSEG